MLWFCFIHKQNVWIFCVYLQGSFQKKKEKNRSIHYTIHTKYYIRLLASSTDNWKRIYPAKLFHITFIMRATFYYYNVCHSNRAHCLSTPFPAEEGQVICHPKRTTSIETCLCIVVKGNLCSMILQIAWLTIYFLKQCINSVLILSIFPYCT